MQHGNVRLGAGIGHEDLARVRVAGEKVRDGGGVLDRGREAHAAQAGAHGLKAAEGEEQLVAALRFRQRVDFVDHDALEALEDARRVLVGGEECKAFGRGQQNMWRVGALAALGRRGGVAGAVLDADGQVHL